MHRSRGSCNGRRVRGRPGVSRQPDSRRPPLPLNPLRRRMGYDVVGRENEKGRRGLSRNRSTFKKSLPLVPSCTFLDEGRQDRN